jgi:ADP-ribose pyrophosphatase
MPLNTWKTISRTIERKNPWWTYFLDAFEMPGGKRGEYHSVHTNGSSMVVPVLPDGKILVVNQYRYLVNRESVEFPCGSVKDGSSYEQTAAHELQEETGYRAETISLAGMFNPYNGVTDEFCRVYVAHGLTYVGGVPDETEEFELKVWSPDDIDARIRDGSLWDGMTIAAWAIAKPRIMFP